jgi:hypothetical protein
LRRPWIGRSNPRISVHDRGRPELRRQLLREHVVDVRHQLVGHRVDVEVEVDDVVVEGRVGVQPRGG